VQGSKRTRYQLRVKISKSHTWHLHCR